jgi:hypothetical protein
VVTGPRLFTVPPSSGGLWKAGVIRWSRSDPAVTPSGDPLIRKERSDLRIKGRRYGYVCLQYRCQFITNFQGTLTIPLVSKRFFIN